MMANGKSDMRVLLTGYSGYAQIDGHNTLMTSFSLSMNENIINSTGVGKLYYETIADDGTRNGQFTRYKMNAVRNYPGYEFSITAEANYDILDYILRQITTRFHSFITVKFLDNASGIRYEFDKCCLTSFSLGVSNNSVAIATFGFVAFQDEIEVKFCQNGYDNLAGRNAPGAIAENGARYENADGTGNLVGAVLMPYWAWGIDTQDIYGQYFNDEDLYEFTISYSQAVTPKFGCYGLASDLALTPSKIIMGVPEVKYELAYLVANPTDVSDYLIRSNKVAISRRNMIVKYHQTRPEGSIVGQGEDVVDLEFTLMDCYPDSYSPQLASKGDANKISVSGTVYGRISY